MEKEYVQSIVNKKVGHTNTRDMSKLKGLTISVAMIKGQNLLLRSIKKAPSKYSYMSI